MVYMETIGDRLKSKRTGAQLSQEALGLAAGVSKQAVSAIESGATKSPEATTIEALARRLGVSTRWLVTGRGPEHPPTDAANNDAEGWADITGYAQSVGLGSGTEAQEYAETHKLKFRADSLHRKRLNPHKLHVMYGDGDSMLPRIMKGDAILFDESDKTPRDGKLYIVEWRGEIYVKRCDIIDESVYFKADNPAGDHHWKKPKRVDSPRDPITVIGRVRWIGSWED